MNKWQSQQQHSPLKSKLRSYQPRRMLASRPPCARFANYREMVWRGQSQPGLLDDGINGGTATTDSTQGAPNNVYMPNR